MKIKTRALLTVLAISVAQAATAASYTLYGPTGYRNSGTHSYEFDLTSQLGANEVVRGASIEMLLVDDGDRRQVSSRQVRTAPFYRNAPYQEAYECGNVFNSRTCYRTRYRQVPVYNYRTEYTYFDDAERASLWVSGHQAHDQTTYYSTTTSTFRDSGYRGTMQLLVHLNAFSLPALNDTKRLGTRLTMTGDAIIRSFRLLINTELRTDPGNGQGPGGGTNPGNGSGTPSEVPLPASAALLLAGLGGLAGLRRKAR